MEDRENELDQDNIGQDHEKRCDDDRVGGCASYTSRAATGSHALKTRDGANDESVDRRLEGGRQESAEGGSLKAVFDELMECERLDQRLRKPSRHQAASIRYKGQERKHQDLSLIHI